MPKVAIKIICSKEELDILNKFANDEEVQFKMVERAKIILLCHNGLRNDQISKKLNFTSLTIAKWRNRFNQYRIDGLKDKKRSGKPKKYDETIRKNILKLIEQPASFGKSKLDVGTIAKHLEVSHDIVWRTLRNEGIQLQRKRLGSRQRT